MLVSVSASLHLCLALLGWVVCFPNYLVGLPPRCCLDLGRLEWIWALMCLSPQLYTCQQLIYCYILASWCHCCTSQSCSVLEQFACFFCGVIPFTVISGPQKHPSALELLFCGQPFARHCPAGECPLAVDSERVA